MSSDNFTPPDVLAEKLLDAEIPGFYAEFYPDEAEEIGSIEEAPPIDF